MAVTPAFLSYALSFVYVAIYWNNHHHFFHLVRHVSGMMLWANMHLLFWLSLIPFATGWMGEKHFAPVDIYRRYLALKSVHALREELADAGIKSKRRMRPEGAAYGDHTLSRGALYLILQNRLYRGEIPHKGSSYPGEHPAIVRLFCTANIPSVFVSWPPA